MSSRSKRGSFTFLSSRSKLTVDTRRDDAEEREAERLARYSYPEISPMHRSAVAADARVVVIDAGSGSLKIGYSSQDVPALVPSIVSDSVSGEPSPHNLNAALESPRGFVEGDALDPTPRRTGSKTFDFSASATRGRSTYYSGAEAWDHRTRLKIHRPIQRGAVKSWNEYAKLVEQSFKKSLGIFDMSDTPVMVLESPLIAKKDRHTTAEILFEHIGIGALHIGVNSAMPLHSEGLSTGLVVDSGYGVTRFVPVHEGVVYKKAIKRSLVSGATVDDALKTLLATRADCDDLSEADLVAIKEELCVVADDYERSARMTKGMLDLQKKTYRLPDGTAIPLTHELFTAPEVLFSPGDFGHNMNDLQTDVFLSIVSAPPHTHRELYKNVLLAGGNTMFSNLSARLERELKLKIPGGLGSGATQEDPRHSGNLRRFGANVKVIAPPYRSLSSWIGASVLAEMDGFRKTQFVSKRRYEEEGARSLRETYGNLA